MPLPEPIEHIYAGHHISCALSVAGNAYCWGLNRDGQLGAGHQRNIGDDPDELGQNLASIQLPNDQPIRALCLGAQHVCALDLSGDVLCWGSNTRGQLGQNDRVFRGTTPESIDTLTPVNLGQSATAITCGDLHSCAILSDGTAKCWGTPMSANWDRKPPFPSGDNQGEMNTLSMPFLSASMLRFGSSRRERATPSTFETGQVKCWGQDAFGALGLPAAGHRGDDPGEMGPALPSVPFEPNTQIASLHAGNGTDLRIRDDRMFCWGNNGRYGTVGRGQPSPVIRWTGEAGAIVPRHRTRRLAIESARPPRLCPTRRLTRSAAGAGTKMDNLDGRPADPRPSAGGHSGADRPRFTWHWLRYLCGWRPMFERLSVCLRCLLRGPMSIRRMSRWRHERY